MPLTAQFSSGALSHVPRHFIHDRLCNWLLGVTDVVVSGRAIGPNRRETDRFHEPPRPNLSSLPNDAFVWAQEQKNRLGDPCMRWDLSGHPSQHTKRLTAP